MKSVTVRARYRGEKLIKKGLASITVPESFSCALFIGDEQVFALDTNPGQPHTSLAFGEGLPHFGRTIQTDTHRHIWAGCYGYVEPVEPSLLDVCRTAKDFGEELDLTFQRCLATPASRGATGAWLMNYNRSLKQPNGHVRLRAAMLFLRTLPSLLARMDKHISFYVMEDSPGHFYLTDAHSTIQHAMDHGAKPTVARLQKIANAPGALYAKLTQDGEVTAEADSDHSKLCAVGCTATRHGYL